MPTHVILIGASIGRAWNLAEWPCRVGAPDFTAEALAVWQFDKTEAVEEVLLRPARKFHFTRTYLRSLFEPSPRAPNVVILKECSSYFPGDQLWQRRQVRLWLERLQGRGVRTMLATVVPVTAARATADPAKQASLLEYNRWIREYSQAQSVPVLDLERAVSPEGRDSDLPVEYALPDGTHLNAAGYAALDRALLAALRGMWPKGLS
jgi:hypothetical protein